MGIFFSYLAEDRDYVDSKAIAIALFEAIKRESADNSEENRNITHLLVGQLPNVDSEHLNAYYSIEKNSRKYDKTLLTIAAQFSNKSVFEALVKHPKINLNRPQRKFSFYDDVGIHYNNTDTVVDILIKAGNLDFLKIILEQPELNLKLEKTLKLIIESQHPEKQEMLRMVLECKDKRDQQPEPKPNLGGNRAFRSGIAIR